MFEKTEKARLIEMKAEKTGELIGMIRKRTEKDEILFEMFE